MSNETPGATRKWNALLKSSHERFCKDFVTRLGKRWISD
jgi:hypothetical protein